MSDSLRRRNRQIQRSSVPLPGSIPYDNYRPVNVPGRFDGYTLVECLCDLHPHIGRGQWREWFQAGHLLRGSEPVPMNTVVRGGEQFQHLFPDTVEPDVDAGIEVLWEDDELIVVYKPAPLPMHPCGRFNLNTMTSLLRSAYDETDLRVVHRLDANTTGVVVLARTRTAATHLRRQFEDHGVRKRYIVRCDGHPADDAFVRKDPVAKQCGGAGSRKVDSHGHDAVTRFRVLRRFDDDTAVLEAYPQTGRTNQIRVHLWAMGMPVLGDPAYLKGGKQNPRQTLAMDEPPMCLHAAEICLAHPGTGRRHTFSASSAPWMDPTPWTDPVAKTTAVTSML